MRGPITRINATASWSVKDRPSPFRVYYVIPGEGTAWTEHLLRLQEAYRGIPLLVWSGQDTPNLSGVECDTDIVVAPYRGNKLDRYYVRWLRAANSANQVEYLILHPDERYLDLPCTRCTFAEFSLNGSCTPMDAECCKRIKKWTYQDSAP